MLATAWDIKATSNAVSVFEFMVFVVFLENCELLLDETDCGTVSEIVRFEIRKCLYNE